jgi:hypothetical protein
VVTGMVTLDGQPVEAGAVRFVPVDGASPTGGAPIKAGRYEATVSPGAMRVEITAPKVVGQRKTYDTPDSPVEDVVEEMIPARYNLKTELTVEVKSGKQSQDFKLTSQ